MKYAFLLLVGLAFLLAAAPASAVVDNTNSSEEYDLYEIYNTFFGTSFTSSSGASSGLGNGLDSGLVAGGLDGLLVASDSIFTSNPDAVTDSTAFFLARYAGRDSRFGYYEASGAMPGGDPTSVPGTGDFHHLFDVVGGSHTIVTDPGFDPFATLEPDSAAGGAVIPLSAFPIGFYMTAASGTGQTYFSEEVYNPDNYLGIVDHMITLQVVDSLGNIIPDTYILAWEDGNLLGDMDFNDLVIQVTIPGSGTRAPQPIAEPTTAGLLLLGLSAAFIRRRFRG